MMEKNLNFENGYSNVLIYVFEINDTLHRGCVKVGKATLKSDTSIDKLPPNCSELNKAARARIDSYTRTASIQYNLLHTELAVWHNPKHGNKLEYFGDNDVHNVLMNSGFKKEKLGDNRGREWFRTNVETVKNAISCVKHNQKVLAGNQIVKQAETINFRPEQIEAIESTVKKFKGKGTKMLWNAKMRFGKTLSALEVIRRLGYKKSIIITHRPVVNASWYEDFGKIFGDTNYIYCSKALNETDRKSSTLTSCLRGNNPFIYFASIQDLRGAKRIGGKFDKDDEVFDTDWDCVVIDEAHEGTKTFLGDNVVKNIIKDETRAIYLSGTPFNIIGEFNEDETYTWDYIMEQRAKTEWDMNNFGDANPYEGLPALNIYTYDIADAIPDYIDLEDKAFNFREFFRVWTGHIKDDGRALPTKDHIGKFIHEDDVRSFLHRLCEKGENSNYPFSESCFREYFNHSLWMVPGVKEAKALKELLEESNSPFSLFDIVNVAGEEDDDTKYKSALEKLQSSIGDHPEQTHTITLSCGRLTTGVSVPAWTAVLMLNGSANTSASSYLQTIFRVQTPANINGRIKDRCYVFDFAPDRTLQMVAEAGKLGARVGKRDEKSEEKMREFLNYCPVIAIKGSEMKEYSVDSMLKQLKRFYAARVAQNGFDDIKLYNDELLKLNDLDLAMFEKLKAIVGESKATPIPKQILINESGLGPEELEQAEEAEKKKKKKIELTEEEKEALAKKKKAVEERGKAISILRSISIRIPLMVYGSDKSIDEDITIENFADMIDDISWEEFMPRGVSKSLFNEFVKYYDRNIFIEAGNQIRRKVKASDDLAPTDRIKKIAEIFNTFKNPDKETVLTPWRVVNLHVSETLGGYDFYNDDHSEVIDEPRFVKKGEITKETLSRKDAKILEINSKSGLYPLYATYSIYRSKLTKQEEDYSIDELNAIWDGTIKENIFVVCKTPMAKAITKRTLLGYRGGKTNAHACDDLINQFKNKAEFVIKKIKNPSYWNVKGISEMKFDAIIGNPPYQDSTSVNNRAGAIYPYFYDVAEKLTTIYSLISPARFLFNTGLTSKEWNRKMLQNQHLKVVYYEQDATKIFPRTDIKGGIAITLYNSSKNYGAIGEFIPEEELRSIASKFKKDEQNNLPSVIFGGRSDLKFTDYFLKCFPQSISDRLKAIQKEHSDVTELSPNEEYELKSSTFEVLPYVFENEKPQIEENYIKILGLISGKRIYRWVRKEYMTPRYPENNNIDAYKILVAESNGSGTFGEVLSSPIVVGPSISSTPTFISIGKFKSEREANNALKYIKSKMVRTLLGIKKKTQHNSAPNWAYIPLQDFSENSDIDWSKPISEIDKQLYKKYNLTEEEIDFIETKVLPMA